MSRYLNLVLDHLHILVRRNDSLIADLIFCSVIRNGDGNIETVLARVNL